MNTKVVRYEELTRDEKETLQYLGGYREWDFIAVDTFESLAAMGLAIKTNDDEWYGPNYAITDAGREMIDAQTLDWQDES